MITELNTLKTQINDLKALVNELEHNLESAEKKILNLYKQKERTGFVQSHKQDRLDHYERILKTGCTSDKIKTILALRPMSLDVLARMLEVSRKSVVNWRAHKVGATRANQEKINAFLKGILNVERTYL